MAKSFFFVIIGLVFIISSIFHFSRLAFEWKIIINEWMFPSWASGLIVVIGIFISYWSLKLKKELKNSPKEHDKNNE